MYLADYINLLINYPINTVVTSVLASLTILSIIVPFIFLLVKEMIKYFDRYENPHYNWAGTKIVKHMVKMFPQMLTMCDMNWRVFKDSETGFYHISTAENQEEFDRNSGYLYSAERADYYGDNNHRRSYDCFRFKTESEIYGQLSEKFYFNIPLLLLFFTAVIFVICTFLDYALTYSPALTLSFLVSVSLVAVVMCGGRHIFDFKKRISGIEQKLDK